ncbi:hypothetical protein LPMP_353400 [Leishmania panamensis]|uniref:Uncharacterized protein n=4 Tax=Viannia TaxID=37616 RepID=A0A088SKZ2_LEIPA|nr:hypothetical protein LPMP_353400 [Leishmania panamensis]AIO02477.1 hypothetical protein LPMP_353400 [Leishmania panamensis]CCM19678.1 hypothetical protein, conserved [Leishmania guyanensis]
MLRRSPGRHIKPFLHAFSPGVRPSEKGMLYRNNYMNAHAQVASIPNTHRSYRERTTFLLLLIPEQIFLTIMILVTGCVAVTVVFRQQPFTTTVNKDRWLSGGMNPHEQYERNATMSQIFEMHKAAIDNTRAELTQPEVFSAPSGYHSPSGLYNP